MADYNYLQDIMDSVYGSQYWDQMADDFYRPEQNQQDDERLLDLIRGESRRTALPGGNRGGNAGAAAAMQPVPQAPDMAQSEAGRQYVDKTDLAPQAAAPVQSPAPVTPQPAMTPEEENAIYQAIINGGGASFSAPASAVKPGSNSSTGISVGATTKPATTAKPASATPAAKPTTSTGINLGSSGKPTSSTKPKNQSTGIKF
jgi:hypothetical protein